MPTPVAIPILSETSTSSLPEGADERMKEKLDALRKPAADENPEKTEKDTPFNFDTPANATLPYPGLDGHPRRIVPIPVSIPVSPIQTPEEIDRMFCERDAQNQKEIWARAAKN